jgi:hypothetical protein
MKPGRPCNAVLGEPDEVIVKMLVDGVYDPDMANPDERRAAVAIMLDRRYGNLTMSRRLNCCERTIERYVNQLGRQNERANTILDHEAIRADYAAGVSVPKIALAYGCCTRQVYHITEGMPRRGRFGARNRPIL